MGVAGGRTCTIMWSMKNSLYLDMMRKTASASSWLIPFS
jgi:hypothetical protein